MHRLGEWFLSPAPAFLLVHLSIALFSVLTWPGSDSSGSGTAASAPSGGAVTRGSRAVISAFLEQPRTKNSAGRQLPELVRGGAVQSGPKPCSQARQKLSPAVQS